MATSLCFLEAELHVDLDQLAVLIPVAIIVSERQRYM